MEHCWEESRQLAACRIKGVWKLAMRRFFAQYKEYNEMEEANVPYRGRNLVLAQKRHILRARRRMIAGVTFVK